MEILIVALFTAAAVFAQTAPAFDAASIKLSTAPPGSASEIREDTGRIAGRNVTLKRCIRGAYDIPESRIVGGPKWADEERYDIDAKSAGPAGGHELMAMLQQLLAERFSLKLHHGTKQLPVYEMVVAKGGIKMKDAATDPAPPQLGKGEDGKPLSTLRWSKNTTLMQAYSMKSLTNLLTMPAAQVGRPVLDKTGLTSTYNFKFDWSIYSATAAAGNSTTEDAPSIFTALGEIGLKLQPATASVETIAIDHVERPSPD